MYSEDLVHQLNMSIQELHDRLNIENHEIELINNLHSEIDTLKNEILQNKLYEKARLFRLNDIIARIDQRNKIINDIRLTIMKHSSSDDVINKINLILERDIKYEHTY